MQLLLCSSSVLGEEKCCERVGFHFWNLWAWDAFELQQSPSFIWVFFDRFPLRNGCKITVCSPPCIVSFTVGFPVSDEASAGLVQILAALCTLEAGCVPLQVRGHSHDVLVVYLTPAAHAHRNS